MFWMDQYYLFLVIPAMLLAVFASIQVNSTFDRYNRVYNARGYTAAMAARQILDQNGLQNVQIERVAGKLSDHYDPRANVIRLSDSVYGSTSVGAIGVAAHECGHAIQYATGYFPIRIRAAIIQVNNNGSNLGKPLENIVLLFGCGWLEDLGILL